MMRVRLVSISMLGGYLLSSLFFFSPANADTVTLKNGKGLKGLIVEKHADRIILSTEKGEIPVLLSGIKNIQYDESEQNFMQIGRGYEAERKYGEALAYFEKALEINPGFEEARVASVAMRNHFWAQSTEGPQSEMEKQQAIYDRWGKGGAHEEAIKTKMVQATSALRKNLGLALEKKGDWVRVSQTVSKKDAAIAGLKRGDRLAAIDGQSLRYLSPEVVAQKMIEPRFSSFTLEYERNCFVRGEGRRSIKNLGLEVKLEYKGAVVKKIQPSSPAAEAGLKEGDELVAVGGAETRYLSLNQITKKIEDSKSDSLAFTVRRLAFLTRR